MLTGAPSSGGVGGLIRRNPMLPVLVAGLGSIIVGWLAARSPMAAAGAIAAIIAVAIIARSPALWLAIGLLTIAASPDTLYGITAGKSLGNPQIWKGLLYVALFPLLYLRGVRREYLLVFAAYGVATAMSRLAGTPVEGLSLGQTLSSLMTLCIAWIYVAVAWDWERDQVFLKVIAALPLVSVFLGLLLTPAGWSVFQSGSPPRLEGAAISALLGGVGVGATSASIFLWRRSGWRPAIWLGLFSALCVFASLGRGAIIALLMAGAPQAWRFMRHLLRQTGGWTYLKLLFGGLVLLVAVFALALPGLQKRAETGVSYNAETRTLEKSAGSGRTDAWHSFYKLAEENLAFGRGMGAGPIAKIPQQGFTAQHNEYLRLLLELGYVGGLLVLFSMIIVLWRLVRSAPAVVRPDAIALVLAFAVYSATDNTLTARHLAVALLGTLAIGVAPAWSRATAPASDDEEQEELDVPLDGGPAEPEPVGSGGRRLRPRYAG